MSEFVMYGQVYFSLCILIIPKLWLFKEGFFFFNNNFVQV